MRPGRRFSTSACAARETPHRALSAISACPSQQLRARVDELTAGARERLPRSERANLINAALERGMPRDAQAAVELVVDHARRLELSSDSS